MKFSSEFRDPHLVEVLIRKIREATQRDITLMEVCGGHTMAIHRYGLPSLLPDNIHLVSGPGCPVCVSSRAFIDHAIALGRKKDIILCTYGDLIRVPGSLSSLDQEKAAGIDVRIVPSTLEALRIAREQTDKQVVFLGIGFETTAPGSAAAVAEAYQDSIQNFFLLSSHKIMPPAMEALITEGVKINGYLCPGHVSTITGSSIYNFIPEKYGLACVIAGFEPLDILQSVLMLARQIEQGKPSVEIQYKRVVRPQGNEKALALLEEVFQLEPDWWRGFGMIPASGMKLREKYAAMDAAKAFEVELPPVRDDKGCICGEILKGLKKPLDCGLFGKVCTPTNPVGSCMVSNEGSCAAHYRYAGVSV
jgi:hydrogenase expression/formation protein HypD